MQGRADGKFTVVVVHFFMIDNVFKRLDNVAVNVAMTQQISLLHVNSITAIRHCSSYLQHFYS